MKKLFLIAVLSIVALSCTDNTMARSWGGTEDVQLRPNEKFLNITWKETSLWIVTQDTITGKYYAREKSAFGNLEGTIIITPHSTKQP